MARGFEARTAEELVHRLVTGYVVHGYVFYVHGRVGEGKDPEAAERRMVEKFGCDLSEKTRVRRKRSGFANCGFLRYGREYVIVATHGAEAGGVHPFFAEHGFGDSRRSEVRDFRYDPLQFQGYSIGYRYEGVRPKGKPGGKRRRRGSVRIARERWLELKGYFAEMATRRGVEWLSEELWKLPFYPYAPVRQQLLSILRAVNRARKQAGYEEVPVGALRLRRRPVLPSESERKCRRGFGGGIR